MSFRAIAAVLGILLGSGVAFPPGQGAASDGLGASAFVSGTEDLPLMEGLSEVAEAGLAFDTPTGRVIEARAMGRVGAREVEAFYAQTLPQLGWTRVAPLTFVREGEHLRVEVSRRGDLLVVQFLISPQSF